MARSDPRNLRAKWQRALEERRKAGAETPPIDVTPRPTREARGERRTPAPSTDAPSADAPKERRAPPPGTDAPSERAPASDSPGAYVPDADAPKERAPTKEKPSPPGSGVAQREDESQPKNAAPSSPWGAVAAAVILVGGVGFALRAFITADDPDGGAQISGATAADLPDTTAAPGAGSAEPELPIDPPKPPPRARCSAPMKEPFVVGDAPSPKPATSADSDDSLDDELAPFAVELGRGVRFADGFAVGTQRQAEGGTVSMVATLGLEGDGGKLVRLARSRGDFDPPVVAAAGSSILAAMMEPNAGGRAIRLAKIDGDRVTWGPELAEGRDESLAIDIAASGSRALVVWDDVPIGRERSVIELATLDIEAMRGSGARPVTPPGIDADVPRLAVRPGGYWLSYLAHGEPPTEPTAAKDDGSVDAGSRSGAKGGKRDENPDDSDTEAAGEAIAHQWIELVPLDESGILAGAPRAITPKDSRVIGYDLDDGQDGRAFVIYREDDTPSGSNGGRVKVVVADLGGVGEPRVIAEEGVGAGVPQLHGGWVVIHSLSGPVRVGAIDARGELASELAPEPLLRQGEILAADGAAFLVATPAGRAMKLGVARCTR